jgi:hypothetical protein
VGVTRGNVPLQVHIFREQKAIDYLLFTTHKIIYSEENLVILDIIKFIIYYY